MISIFTANLTCLEDAKTLGLIFLAVSFWLLVLAGLCIYVGLLHLACAKLSVPLLQQKKRVGCPFGNDKND